MRHLNVGSITDPHQQTRIGHPHPIEGVNLVGRSEWNNRAHLVRQGFTPHGSHDRFGSQD